MGETPAKRFEGPPYEPGKPSEIFKQYQSAQQRELVRLHSPVQTGVNHLYERHKATLSDEEAPEYLQSE